MSTSIKTHLNILIIKNLTLKNHGQQNSILHRIIHELNHRN